MRTEKEIQDKFDELVKSRNGMSLETHAVTTLMAIEHEIYVLVWVLGKEKIYLPFQEAALSQNTSAKRTDEK